MPKPASISVPNPLPNLQTKSPLALMAEVQLTLGREQAELLAEVLMQCGALSVAFADAHANTDQEQELFGEPGFEDEQFLWDLNLVTVLFRNAHEANALMLEALRWIAQEQPTVAAELQELAQAANTGMLAINPIPEQDWVRLTQSQFDPIVVHPRLTITPSWHANGPNFIASEPGLFPHGNLTANSVRMILDPGLAFGTGSHPTTALCLRWLCEQTSQNKQTHAHHLEQAPAVLDYGCGSGILAIAAMQLGAASALAVDIDPQALISTQSNAHNNQVQVSTALPDDLEKTPQFDWVLANILSGPLKVLAPLLCSKVKPLGILVLSGILERQTQELIACYAPWLPLKVWGQHDGWVCLAGQKPLP